MNLDPGTRVGDAVVDRRIGDGSHATIYRVRRDDGSRAALKVLHTREPVARERLLREGRALSRVNHPNVVKAFGSLDVNGSPALLLELVAGPTLAEWLDAGGAASVDEALELFRGLARGVQAIHAQGLVHRDLNPGNVLLAIAGDKRVIPKIADFGLVRLGDEPGLSNPGALGTPAYMAPEQIADGRSAGPAADLFALGCILYELLGHERAFVGADLLALYEAARRRDYVPLTTLAPDVPDDVARIVDSLLDPEPVGRPPDVASLLEALYLDDAPDTTFDELPAWSEAPVSTATAARVRELAPPGTAAAAPERASSPQRSRAPAALVVAGLLIGLAAAAWVAQ